MRLKSISGLILILSLLAMALTSCSSEKSGNKVVTINGAGATFPYPVYAQWGYKYEKVDGVRLNYQSIGSGGGIAQIKAKTVHFGASDAPVKPEELEKFGLFQFPMIIGGVVPVVNIAGIEQGSIKLTPQNLADIYLGKIKKWNDATLRKTNPGVDLPDLDITTVHRADGSGTTWIFTNYLAKVSEEWKEKVGFGKAPAWPNANAVAGKGNEGVSVFVKKVNGAIGYVEYAYALQNQMNYTLLQNKEGHFVAPTIESFQAAAANADWKNAPGYYLVLTNQPGEQSWPITGASFILVYKDQPDAATAGHVLSFFDWSYRNGGEMAKKLHYVPMPANVVEMVEESWSREITSKGAPVWKKSTTSPDQP